MRRFSNLAARWAVGLLLVIPLQDHFAQESSVFFYSGEEEIHLTPAVDKVAVRFVEASDRQGPQSISSSLGMKITQKESALFRLSVLESPQALTSLIDLKNRVGVEFATPVYVYSDGTEYICGNQLIVRFKNDVEAKARESLIESIGATIVEWSDADPNRYVVEVPWSEADQVFDKSNGLHRNELVEYSHPNFQMKLKKFGIPNDFYYSSQWHLPQIRAAQGWDIETGNSNIVIAVVDDGVDQSHEDLLWDLVTGWDAVDQDFDPTPNCPDGHGTACAGLAAGEGNNGFGIAGVAYGANIMPVRVFDTGGTTADWLRDGIYSAWTMGADVLSCSWGGGAPIADVDWEIDNATFSGRGGKGCVVVFAAGNNGGAPVEWPANRSNTIAVGAVDRFDIRWSYSARGFELDVMAPSGQTNLQGDVVTTDIMWECGYEDFSSYDPHYTFRFGGTSAACPQVAGLAGLVLSQYSEFTWTQVRDFIKNNADYLGNPYDYGEGRINVENTLKDVIDDINVHVTSPNGGEVWSPDDQVTITWTACGYCELTSQEIALSTNGGASYQVLGTVGGAARQFSWTVAGAPSTTCLIRVRSSNAYYTSEDVSDGFFEITAPPEFDDATSPLLAQEGQGGSFAWVDYDGDGDLDLYVGNSGASYSDILLSNEGGHGSGSANFADRSGVLGAGLNSGASVWGDYDNDGDLDAYLLNETGANKLFRNDGGSFTDVTSSMNVGDTGYGTSASWGDYDDDGDLDLYVGNWGSGNVLYRNNGGTSFTKMTTSSLAITASTAAVSWVDYDNDSDMDMYIAAFGTNYLYRNDTNGYFWDVTSDPSSPSHPLFDPGTTNGFSWGDFDNDGDLDIVLARDSSPNKLFRNDGGGTFVDVTPAGIGVIMNSSDVDWGDYDNDGDLDVYFANWGWWDKIFRNDGGLSFTDIGELPTGYNSLGTGVAWGDYNNDGFLDAYAVTWGGNKLLRNNLGSTGSHWLEVDLSGVESNKKGAGARISAKTGGLIQYREVTTGTDVGQNALTVHFGLGAATSVDWVKVRWTNGYEHAENPAGVDQRIVIVEELPPPPPPPPPCKKCPIPKDPVSEAPEATLLEEAFPNPFNPATTIRFSLASRDHVTVSIFSVAGKRIKRLIEGELGPGRYDYPWDGRDDAGRELGSGVYFILMKTSSGYEETNRVLLLK